MFALLCDFSDQLGEDLSRDLEEYDLSVEPETFINSVFVLMEKELENMDVSPLQIESAMGDTGLTDAQRRDVNDLFETIKEAKQETHRTGTCTNPYQNVVPENVLRDLSSQLTNLTEEQRSFVDFAEKRILDNKQVLAFINARVGTGKTYTLNTFKVL